MKSVRSAALTDWDIRHGYMNKTLGGVSTYFIGILITCRIKLLL